MFETNKSVCTSQKWPPGKKRFASQNQLLDEVSYQSRKDASPKKARPNGWYPKLTVKIGCQQNCIPAKNGCQPKATTSQVPVQAKRCCQAKGLPAKRGYHPKAAASQKPVQAKSCCWPKRVASQTWLPAKRCFNNTGNGNNYTHKIMYFL